MEAYEASIPVSCHIPTSDGFTRELAILYHIAAGLGETINEVFATGTLVELDHFQQRSFRILWYWWTRFRDGVEVRGDAPPAEWPRLAVEGKFYDLNQLSSSSEFYHAGWALFECEFDDTDNPWKQRILHERRVDAALHFACYFTAIACKNDVSNSLRSPTTPVPPRKLLGPDDLPGLHPCCHSGSSMISCSWIKDASELPFYLWHIQSRCTVQVDSLSERPSYTAISHTWGRWRTGSSVKLTGVPEWDIPQNSMFDVCNLPTILAKVPVSTPYLWFDLVCIPQNHSKRADEEIAKQASIFRQATHTIIWFNTITSWAGLRDTVRWMSEMYLVEDSLTRSSVSDTATGLFQDYVFRNDITADDMEAIGWFTSLWTLQEICLRPDMWLCDGNWNLFTVGDNVPIPFNTIIGLVGQCMRISRDEATVYGRQDLDLSVTFMSRSDRLKVLINEYQYPRGFVELLELVDRTGMRDLHIMKKEYIMLLGSQRYCESRRGEAIMSVLDAKEWKTLPNPGDLVLGQYELEFVREVAKGIGASFYNSLSFCAEEHSTMDTMTRIPRGSLMPFEDQSAEVPVNKMILNWEFGTEIDHPSVKSWIIHQNGSVEIPEAAILTSTPDPSKRILISTIWLTYLAPDDTDPRFDLGVSGERHRSCDLRQWCKDYHPQSANYAVELGQVLNGSRGILLKETTLGSNILYKVGNYLTSMIGDRREATEASLTPSEKMSWVVL